MVELGPYLVEARPFEGVVEANLRPEGLPLAVARVLFTFVAVAARARGFAL